MLSRADERQPCPPDLTMLSCRHLDGFQVGARRHSDVQMDWTQSQAPNGLFLRKDEQVTLSHWFALGSRLALEKCSVRPGYAPIQHVKRSSAW